MQRGRTFTQVDVHTIWIDREGPDETARRDARVEVMALRRKCLKVILTFKEVQSDESEGAAVMPSVLPDEDALHEPDIGIKEELGVSRRVRSGSLDMRKSDKAIEIGDRRGLVDYTGRIGGQKGMQHRRPRTTGLDTSRNGLRFGTARWCGMGQRRPPEC